MPVHLFGFLKTRPLTCFINSYYNLKMNNNLEQIEEKVRKKAKEREKKKKPKMKVSGKSVFGLQRIIKKKKS